MVNFDRAKVKNHRTSNRTQFIRSFDEHCKIESPEVHLLPYITGGLEQLYRQINTHSVPSLQDYGYHTSSTGHFQPKGKCILALRYVLQEVLDSSGQSAVLISAQDMFAKNRPVVIKVLHSKFYELGAQESMCLWRLAVTDPNNYSHTLRLLNTFTFDSHFCMVFDPLIPHSLTDVFLDIPSYMVMAKIRKVALRLIASLGFFHQQNIIHADLKPENILLKTKNDLDSVHIVDFGNAIHYTHREVSLYYDDFELQTPIYRAPEVMFGMPFGTEIDMWSLGCILAELYTGTPIFWGTSKMEIMTGMKKLLGPLPSKVFQRGKFFQDLKTFTGSGTQKEATSVLLEHLGCADMDFANFLAGLLRYDPSERLTPQEAAVHPFLAAEFPLAFLMQSGANTGYPSISLTEKVYQYRPKIAKDIKRRQPSSVDLLHIGTTITEESALIGQPWVAKVDPVPRSAAPDDTQNISHQSSESRGSLDNSRNSSHSQRHVQGLRDRNVNLENSGSMYRREWEDMSVLMASIRQEQSLVETDLHRKSELNLSGHSSMDGRNPAFRRRGRQTSDEETITELVRPVPVHGFSKRESRKGIYRYLTSTNRTGHGSQKLQSSFSNKQFGTCPSKKDDRNREAQIENFSTGYSSNSPMTKLQFTSEDELSQHEKYKEKKDQSFSTEVKFKEESKSTRDRIDSAMSDCDVAYPLKQESEHKDGVFVKQKKRSTLSPKADNYPRADACLKTDATIRLIKKPSVLSPEMDERKKSGREEINTSSSKRNLTSRHLLNQTFNVNERDCRFADIHVGRNQPHLNSNTDLSEQSDMQIYRKKFSTSEDKGAGLICRSEEAPEEVEDLNSEDEEDDLHEEEEHHNSDSAQFHNRKLYETVHTHHNTEDISRYCDEERAQRNTNTVAEDVSFSQSSIANRRFLRKGLYAGDTKDEVELLSPGFPDIEVKVKRSRSSEPSQDCKGQSQDSDEDEIPFQKKQNKINEHCTSYRDNHGSSKMNKVDVTEADQISVQSSSANKPLLVRWKGKICELRTLMEEKDEPCRSPKVNIKSCRRLRDETDLQQHLREPDDEVDLLSPATPKRKKAEYWDVGQNRCQNNSTHQDKLNDEIELLSPGPSKTESRRSQRVIDVSPKASFVQKTGRRRTEMTKFQRGSQSDKDYLLDDKILTSHGLYEKKSPHYTTESKQLGLKMKSPCSLAQQTVKATRSPRHHLFSTEESKFSEKLVERSTGTAESNTHTHHSHPKTVDQQGTTFIVEDFRKKRKRQKMSIKSSATHRTEPQHLCRPNMTEESQQSSDRQMSTSRSLSDKKLEYTFQDTSDFHGRKGSEKRQIEQGSLSSSDKKEMGCTSPNKHLPRPVPQRRFFGRVVNRPQTTKVAMTDDEIDKDFDPYTFTKTPREEKVENDNKVIKNKHTVATKRARKSLLGDFSSRNLSDGDEKQNLSVSNSNSPLCNSPFPLSKELAQNMFCFKRSNIVYQCGNKKEQSERKSNIRERRHHLVHDISPIPKDELVINMANLGQVKGTLKRPIPTSVPLIGSGKRLKADACEVDTIHRHGKNVNGLSDCSSDSEKSGPLHR